MPKFGSSRESQSEKDLDQPQVHATCETHGPWPWKITVVVLDRAVCGGRAPWQVSEGCSNRGWVRKTGSIRHRDRITAQNSRRAAQDSFSENLHVAGTQPFFRKTLTHRHTQNIDVSDMASDQTSPGDSMLLLGCSALIFPSLSGRLGPSHWLVKVSC